MWAWRLMVRWQMRLRPWQRRGRQHNPGLHVLPDWVWAGQAVCARQADAATALHDSEEKLSAIEETVELGEQRQAAVRQMAPQPPGLHPYLAFIGLLAALALLYMVGTGTFVTRFP